MNMYSGIDMAYILFSPEGGYVFWICCVCDNYEGYQRVFMNFFIWVRPGLWSYITNVRDNNNATLINTFSNNVIWQIHCSCM